jgi:DNA-binding MarR family transcriptional regulator
MFEQMLKKTNSISVIVTELAKELNMDTGLVKHHLEIMEIDNYGHFSNKKKKHIFVKNLIVKFKKAIE